MDSLPDVDHSVSPVLLRRKEVGLSAGRLTGAGSHWALSLRPKKRLLRGGVGEEVGGLDSQRPQVPVTPGGDFLFWVWQEAAKLRRCSPRILRFSLE